MERGHDERVKHREELKRAVMKGLLEKSCK